MTTNAPAPISGDSCPTGITFGETVTLSPNGETVTNPKTAYFNNGDYVVIWTEIKVTLPRLEFQLFKDNNTKIACTDTSCPGELVTNLGTSRIGTSTVGVYEDYTFVIAWSTQENSYSPWTINIKAFKYNVADSNYQTTTFTKTIPNTQNHGIFGFDTLSLDNGFVLSYMETAYKLITNIYKEKDNYQPQSLPLEPVNASYKKEIIVKAVPTQYFFSVVVSDLMDNRGIYIRNYRIDDGMKVCPVISTESDQCLKLASEQITPKSCYHYISSNPRGIFADLSYGGTLTVAWRDKEKDLDKQRNIRYKAQMFSDIESLSQPFEISDKDDNSQNYDTYLRQVITQSQSRVIATFLKQEAAADKYIVKIFDNNGNLVESNYEALGSSTPSSPNERAFQEMSNSGPTAPPSRKRYKSALQLIAESYTEHATSSTRDRETAVVTREVDVPDELNCKLYNGYKINANRDEDANNLVRVIQVFSDLYSKAYYTETTKEQDKKYIFYTQRDVFKYFINNKLELYGDDKTTLVGIPYFQRPYEPNDIKNIEYSLKCNRPDIQDLYYYADAGRKIGYICMKFLSLQQLPSVNHQFDTQLNKLTLVVFSLLKEPIDTINLKKEECIKQAEKISKIPPITQECLGYFIEACKPLYSCFSYITESKGQFEVCGQEYGLSVKKNYIENYVKATANLKKIDYNELDKDLKTIYTAYLGTQTQLPWSVIKDLVEKIHNGLTQSKQFMYYGEATYFCNNRDWLAYATGNHIFICKKYSKLVEEPKDGDDDTQFLTIIHEISHFYGTIDDYELDGEKYEIYGGEECQAWASDEGRPIITQPSQIMADCFAIFIQSYACKYYIKTCNLIIEELKEIEERNMKIQAHHSNIMNKNENIKFDLDVNVVARIVTLTLTITNNSPVDYYMSRDTILLDSFSYAPFTISGPSFIRCEHNVNYNRSSELLLLHSGEIRSNSLVISNYCSFDTAVPGIYSISMRNGFRLYDGRNKDLCRDNVSKPEEYVHFIGQETFVIGENPEDLALQSLSYESGL